MSVQDHLPASSTPVGGRDFETRRAPLWPHAALAAYAVGWVVTIPVVGKLYAAELIALAGLLLVDWMKTLRRHPILGRVLASYALMLGALVVSDIVNGTSIEDAVRGWANPGFAAVGVLFVATVLDRNVQAFLAYLFVLAVAKALFGDAAYGGAFAEVSFDLATVQETTNYFKVRVVPFLLPAIALLACFAGRRGLGWPIAIFLASALPFFALDARSAGLSLVLAGCILLVIRMGLRPGSWQIFSMFLVLVPILYGAYALQVTYSLEYAPQGHSAQQLRRLKNPYDPLELITQGRSDWTVNLDAIVSRPVFGHGSWARDTDGAFARLRYERTGMFETGYRDEWDQGLIPVHSVLAASWVWGGLAGVAAVLLLLRQLLTLSVAMFEVRSVLLPAAALLLVSVMWDFLFSPLQTVRITFAPAIALLVILTAARFDGGSTARGRSGPAGGGTWV